MIFKRPILTFIDRIKGWHLVLLLITSILVFASCYEYISGISRNDGILAIDINGKQKAVDFSDALYFSVVTEATLGYGDLRPVGISRILSCLQVFMGLVLAGLFVAKLTSSRDRKLRFASLKSEGFWLEIFKAPKGNLSAAFVNLYYDGDNLHYDGTNYNIRGEAIEDFTGLLISVENNILTFYFANLKNKLFNNGISIVDFKSSGSLDKWDYYDAELFDLVDDGKKTTFYGCRLNKEQRRAMSSTKTDERERVIRKIIDDKQEELTERKILL